jgi:hypothetical protein
MSIFHHPPPPFLGAAQPHAARVLPPALIAVAVDNPPTSLGGPVALKMQMAIAAQPDPWTFTYPGRGQPFGPTKNVAGIPGQSVAPPPTSLGGPHAMKALIAAAHHRDWSVNAWPYAFVGRTQPYAQRVAAPRLISVGVDPPAFSHQGRAVVTAEIIASWTPPPPTFQFSLYASARTPQRIRPTARGYVIL